MLYQRRMRLPHVEDPTLNGVPLERMMLSLSSDGITIDNADRVEKNFNDADTAGIRGALRFDINDSWTITPSLVAQKMTAHETDAARDTRKRRCGSSLSRSPYRSAAGERGQHVNLRGDRPCGIA